MSGQRPRAPAGRSPSSAGWVLRRSRPALGVIELDCRSLFSEDGRRRLLWFSAPPGTEGAARLELLSVTGTQSMTTGEHSTSP